METKFLINDVVEWCGTRGIVKNVTEEPDYPIECSFEQVRHTWVFTSDGKCLDWHKEPSLKLIERPKKKIKKYKVLFKNGNRFDVSSGTYSDKEDFESKSYKNVAFIQLIKESEIEVE